MLNRRGHTLLELLVALTVSLLVLAAAVAVARAQYSVQRRLRASIAGAGVRRDGSDVVPLLLGGLSRGAHDIGVGGAQDSVLDFRELVAAGAACASSSGSVLFIDGAQDPAISAPEPSDSAWVLVPSDSGDTWLGSRVMSVAGAAGAAGSCAPGDSLAAPSLPLDGRVALVLSTPPPPGALLALRITRRARLSVYRASDGEWYLGFREWSATMGALETVQPVLGPLVKPAAGRRAFDYRDASGVSLGAAADPSQIATIEVDLAPAHDPADSAIARAAPYADRAVVAVRP